MYFCFSHSLQSRPFIFFYICGIVVYALVMATCAHHDVPAGVALHDRGARLLADHLLRTRGAARADAAYDKDLQ